MKIHQIEKSLTELMEEDQKRLNNSLDKIEYIQECLKKVETDLNIQEIIFNKYKLLNKIKNNIFMNFYIMISFLELPVCLMLLIMLTAIPMSLPINFLVFIVVFLLGIDLYRNYNDVYRVISYDKNKVLDVIFNAINELLKSKQAIENDYKKNIEEVELIGNKINELLSRKKEEIDKVEQYRDELSSLEGYLIGVTKVIEKNIIEELPETNDMVYYINNRLELKKPN